MKFYEIAKLIVDVFILQGTKSQGVWGHPHSGWRRLHDEITERTMNNTHENEIATCNFQLAATYQQINEKSALVPEAELKWTNWWQ